MADESSTDDWLWNKVSEETGKVSARLQSEADKWPLIEFLTRHFGSLLFGAAQKLIDLAVSTGVNTPQNQAVAMTCARLFSDCYAGYELARQGLILQGVVLLRSAFETGTQGLLFLDSPEQASKWMKGTHIKPSTVRILTKMGREERELYDKLCSLAHPNHASGRYFAVPVPRITGLSTALLYGGWYAPKEFAQLAIQFAWAELYFLEGFYERYSNELSEVGLLWKGGPPPKAKASDPGVTWKEYFQIWRSAIIKMMADHSEQTPDDLPYISIAFSDLPEDELRRYAELLKGPSSTV